MRLIKFKSDYYRTCYSILLGCMLGLGGLTANAQKLDSADMKMLAESHRLAGLNELRSFLQLPNDGHFEEQIEANVEWCLATFQAMGFATQRLEAGGAPQVFAQKTYHPDGPNIIFYLQIDGQPVDTSAWHQPHPFVPVLKEKKGDDWGIIPWSRLEERFDPNWRMFARSASDSKGPAIAFITALRILQEQGVTPDFNIKVIMDFQEEMGSPSLAPAVEKYRDLLAADMLLIMDGTRHLSNWPTLTFGARGIATAKITVFGAKRNLHSGQYGNFAPNPVFKLAELIAGMKDENGRVTIPGYYAGIELSDERRTLINDVPENLDEIQQSLGIAQADQVGSTYQEALQYPSLNVRGLRAAWVGEEVRTLIPAEAIAEIDMRLVPETPGERQVELLRQYIIDQGYHLVDGEPTEDERRNYTKLAAFNYRLGSKPFRTDLDSPIGEWLGLAMQRAFGSRYVRMSHTGGSQPIAPFITTLGVPAVSIRIPNPDNSIHAPNENLRLGNFEEGIVMCLAVLTQRW